ncbi:MAG TPA: hypothetical protein DCP91_01155 [Eggerthellaceae bacterium]|nr:hypothetical protein [Eggerthellaceae bacterium]
MEAFQEARASRQKRSPLEVGLRTGGLIVAIVICVLLMRHFNPDQMLILLFPVLIIGILFTVHTVRSNPKNKADTKDEHETCMPILDRYSEKRDVKRLMRDYDEWWEGEHSNYTRMHFAAKVIDILQDHKKYEKALRVLYQVAELPLKGRDHYDFDKYLTKVEPILKEGLEKQRKSQHQSA